MLHSFKQAESTGFFNLNDNSEIVVFLQSMLPKIACPSLPERCLPWTNPALSGPSDLPAVTALTAEFLATPPQFLAGPVHCPHQQAVPGLAESALWQLWRWKALGDTPWTQGGTHHVLSQMGTLSHNLTLSSLLVLAL